MLVFSFFLVATILFAQQGEMQGFTLSGGKAKRKSLAEVMAYDAAHPLPPNFKAVVRPELHRPTPTAQDPDAKAVSKSGSLVEASAMNAPTSMPSPAQIIRSNFLSIWGAYANVPGRESP